MFSFGKQQTLTSQTAPAANAAAAAARTHRPRRAFALHLGEMLVAMFAGMAILGGVIEGIVALAGSSLADAPVAVMAGVMAFSMTAPMVWWMSHRGHAARRSVEMAGSMIVPTLLAIALNQAGAIAEDAVLAVQHLVMIPAMVGVMLWRYEHYSH